MKLNQRETQETIYFILPPANDMEIPQHVAFDDAETAKAYLHRFKTYSDAQIVECHLNPGFYTDINRDCYFILLNMKNDTHSIYLVNDLQRSEQALNGDYFFEGEQICIYLMAKSENEALKEARKIRDQAIVNNEFESELV